MAVRPLATIVQHRTTQAHHRPGIKPCTSRTQPLGVHLRSQKKTAQPTKPVPLPNYTGIKDVVIFATKIIMMTLLL